MVAKAKDASNTMPKVALLQSKAYPTKQEAWVAHERLIIEAASDGAEIICTQELFLTPYFCQTQDTANFSLADEIDGALVERLQSLAASLEVVLVASLFEKRAAGLFHNTAVVIDADGQLLGTYRKNHIPQDPGFEEKFYFTEGDQGYPVWKTKVGTIGVLICWDQWYPEAARLCALKGAEIIFYPTAIGWLPEEKPDLGVEQHSAWETVQRGHAIANGCFVAAVNRVGTEVTEVSETEKRESEFWGQSFAANPYGTLIAKGSVDQEEIVMFDYDKAELDAFREIWPFFRDRRIETYQNLQERWLG